MNRYEQRRCCATYCSYAEEGLNGHNCELEWPFAVNDVKFGSCSGGAKHRSLLKAQKFGSLHEKNRQVGWESR